MKRLIFGLAAIVFAAATAAFTTPKVNLDDAIFQFNTSYSPTKANVEDVTKWQLASDMNGCAEGSARACKIRVTSDHYSGSSLLSNTDIQALESSTGVAYVAFAEAEEIVNKANP